MDISETTAPKTDQQQYDAYLGGITRTVTISAVTKGSPEQPVNVELSEHPGLPFRPNKSMRRVLLAAWGKDSSNYIGRQLTLYGNPNVKWAGKAVGGVEISHLSHIDKALTIPLTATRGKRENFTVQPLIVRDWLAELKQAGNNLDAITALGKAARTANAPQKIIDTITTEYHRANGATQ